MSLYILATLTVAWLLAIIIRWPRPLRAPHCSIPQQQAQSPLLRLPAELRNEIYHLVPTDPKNVQISTSGYTRPALLNTCKSIRYEALHLFYTSNTFTLTIRSYNATPLLKWRNHLNRIGIQKEPQCWLDTTLPSWENLVEWLRLYHAGEVLESPLELGVMSSLCWKGSLEEWIICAMVNIVRASKGESWGKVEKSLRVWRRALADRDRRWAHSRSWGFGWCLDRMMAALRGGRR